MVSKPTPAEVTAGYDGDPLEAGDLSDTDADQLIDEAVTMFDARFSDRILFQSETVDEAVAVRHLARHKWAIALGDTVQSESQAGASATYSVPSATARSLSRTTYGAEFLEYLEETPNVGVFRTR